MIEEDAIVISLMLNDLHRIYSKTGVYNKIKGECIGNEIKTWVNSKLPHML